MIFVEGMWKLPIWVVPAASIAGIIVMIIASAFCSVLTKKRDSPCTSSTEDSFYSKYSTIIILLMLSGIISAILSVIGIYGALTQTDNSNQMFTVFIMALAGIIGVLVFILSTVIYTKTQDSECEDVCEDIAIGLSVACRAGLTLFILLGGLSFQFIKDIEHEKAEIHNLFEEYIANG